MAFNSRIKLVISSFIEAVDACSKAICTGGAKEIFFEGLCFFVVLLCASSPVLMDWAITAQYMGYDTIMMIIEIQLSSLIIITGLQFTQLFNFFRKCIIIIIGRLKS